MRLVFRSRASLSSQVDRTLAPFGFRVGSDQPCANRIWYRRSSRRRISQRHGRPIGLPAGGRLGAGRNAGVNIAYRGDYIMAQLRQHGVLGVR